ncbi:hypothetical protein L917_07124, partial [Phytophthora nicotianae]
SCSFCPSIKRPRSCFSPPTNCPLTNKYSCSTCPAYVSCRATSTFEPPAIRVKSTTWSGTRSASYSARNGSMRPPSATNSAASFADISCSTNTAKRSFMNAADNRSALVGGEVGERMRPGRKQNQ